MKSYEKIFDDAKTMAEHQKIITTYQATGQLDRVDSINKYMKFKR